MWAFVIAIALMGGQQEWSRLPPPADKPDAPTVGPQAKYTVAPNLTACKLHGPYVGSTLVGLTVDSTGKVKDLSIAFSSGNACVDKSVLAAVSRYRFLPGRRDGVPVSLKITTTVGVHNE